MRVALIDHYDSFTFNVIDWLGGPDAVAYVACDDHAAMAALAQARIPLVLSPGPKAPEDAPLTLAILRQCLGKVPILGICLGHQMLAVATGGQVLRARAPRHGTTRTMAVSATPGLLAGLGPTIRAAVYNSLVVSAADLPSAWAINAYCEQGEVQAISRTPVGAAPAFGLQFHPESFMSEGAAVIRANWEAAIAGWATASKPALAATLSLT